jgi:hypothetical protein
MKYLGIDISTIDSIISALLCGKNYIDHLYECINALHDDNINYMANIISIDIDEQKMKRIEDINKLIFAIKSSNNLNVTSKFDIIKKIYRHSILDFCTHKQMDVRYILR